MPDPNEEKIIHDYIEAQRILKEGGIDKTPLDLANEAMQPVTVTLYKIEVWNIEKALDLYSTIQENLRQDNKLSKSVLRKIQEALRVTESK